MSFFVVMSFGFTGYDVGLSRLEGRGNSWAVGYQGDMLEGYLDDRSTLQSITWSLVTEGGDLEETHLLNDDGSCTLLGNDVTSFDIGCRDDGAGGLRSLFTITRELEESDLEVKISFENPGDPQQLPTVVSPIFVKSLFF